jgi:hypothetical protein
MSVLQGRLVGTLHRLFNRSGIKITEPMLHPTPYLFLLDAHCQEGEAVNKISQISPSDVEVSYHRYPIHHEDEEATPYSVAAEERVQSRVHDLIRSLDKAGVQWWTYDGLRKLEQDVLKNGTVWDKIIEEQGLIGARTVGVAVHPDIFYNFLGEKDRKMGGLRDIDLFTNELLQNWKRNGFSIEFNKGQGHNLTPEVLYGPELGSKIAEYHQKLYQRYQQNHKKRYGGMLMGFCFFTMGLYTLWWQWQIVNYRDLERQRWKMSLRITDPDAPLTEQKRNMQKKNEEFLTSYYDDEEEEEEEDAEEGESEEEEAEEEEE